LVGDRVGWPPVQEGQELSPQLIGRVKVAVRAEIALPEPVQGAGDMPGHRVERFLRTRKTDWRSGIDYDPSVLGHVIRDGVDIDPSHQRRSQAQFSRYWRWDLGGEFLPCA
jgi:hypothetical protein